MHSCRMPCLPAILVASRSWSKAAVTVYVNTCKMDKYLHKSRHFNCTTTKRKMAAVL